MSLGGGETTPVNEYRVTKYNSRSRTSAGAYTRDEWISFGDIGRSFGGVELTRDEYQPSSLVGQVGTPP